MSDTLTEGIRTRLREIMRPCPTCGATRRALSLRKVAKLAGPSYATIAKFLAGATVESDTLDRLYDFVEGWDAAAAPAGEDREL